jgi:magnesium chelatase subunit D
VPIDQAARLFEDALWAARLFAVDPVGSGGIALRAQPGPARDTWLRCLRRLLPETIPIVRVPLHVGEDRLLGGLDLAATLSAGRPVAERGLLAAAHDGVLQIAMAERQAMATVSSVAAAIDQRRLVVEREGITLDHPACFGVLALDEGIEPDEGIPHSLADRLAFWLDLRSATPRSAAAAETTITDADRRNVLAARSALSSIALGEDVVEALVSTAMALGVASLRPVIYAARIARSAAALAGRLTVDAPDASLAARLVLGPRATQIPTSAEEEADDLSDLPPDPPPPDASEPESADERERDPTAIPELDDIILAAVAATLPASLLDRLQLRGGSRAQVRTAGKAGHLQKAKRRGRPIGTRRGEPRGGNRLALVDTLRVAAPWQPLRRRDRAAMAKSPNPATRRIEVRPDDLRVTRFKQRTETTAIFVVDASGSTAFSRLAEAKGAIELLLADCYVRRESVALITFRGSRAELLLPPTRSLTRAKRSLAGLPGGGGTPLAAGLDAATELAQAVARKGQTPIIVLLSDGRANIGHDGQPGRAAAEADAMQAAQRLRLTGVTTLFIDTSPRPQAKAESLAAAMAARYLALPRADAAKLSNVVRSSTAGRAAAG